MGYIEDSHSRNQRAGGKATLMDIGAAKYSNNKQLAINNSFAADSAAREQRIKDKQRKPGESQSAADSRAAGSRVQTNKFIPRGVREAQLRKAGYRGKDLSRMADFQSSTAGQNAGMGGEMSDLNGSNSNALPDPIQSPSAAPASATNPPIGTEPALPSQTVAPTGETVAPTTLPEPEAAFKYPGKIQEGSAQGNWYKEMKGGNMTPEKVAQAHEYAKSMGTTFNEKHGYSRQPFMDAQNTAASEDPEAAAPNISRAQAVADGEKRLAAHRESLVGKESPLPAGVKPDDEAAYRESKARADQLKEQFTPSHVQNGSLVGAPKPSAKSKTAVDAANPDPVLPDATPAATSAKLIGAATLPNPEQNPAPKPAKSAVPNYTGGDVAEQEIAKQVEKAAAPKPNTRKTVVSFNGPVVKAVKEKYEEKVAPNIERTKQTISEIPDRIDANVANAKKSYSEGMDKVKNLSGIKGVLAWNDAANKRKSIKDLNSRMKHRSGRGDMTAADVKRYQKLAKKNGVKFDEVKGFYQ